jgi:hypothetical protein
MKWLISAFIFLAVVSVAHADELKIEGYLKPDLLRGEGNYLIYDKDGKAEGRISPDLLWPLGSGRYLIYDKNGKSVGRIRPDLIRKRQYIIEKKK